MKKLLSFLGVFAIGIAPVATVIACGPTNNERNNDNDKVLDGRLRLDADRILDIILENGDEQLIGNPEENLQNFMRVFAYGLATNIDALNNDEQTRTSIYENDDFVPTVERSYEDFLNETNRRWNDRVRAARDRLGNSFDEDFLEELEEEFQKGHRRWQDYQTDFVFQYATQNRGVRTPLDRIFEEVIANFGKSTGLLTSSQTLDNLKSTFFTTNQEFGGQTVNFVTGAIQLGGNVDTDPNRATSWFGQFENFFNGLNALRNGSEEEQETFRNDSAPILLNILNATGGLELEAWLTANPDSSVMLIDDVVWATLDNISTVLDGDHSQWANRLVRRMDNNYELHFNDNNESGTRINGGVQELSADAIIPQLEISYRNLFPNIPNLGNQEAREEINGLFSNSQRYFTNQFFELKKPVAITEFVVRPWETNVGIGFDREINNAPYLGTGNRKYQGLYNFINTFVNSAISGGNGNENAADHTKEMFEGETNYSWDVLVDNAGQLTGITHNGNENTAGGWAPDDALWNDFQGDLSQVTHNNLLTIDSTNYSNTLKYAVYDLLQRDTVTEYSAWTTDSRTGYINDFNYTTELNEDAQRYALPISALIHALDRSGQQNATEKTEQNVYQVLNAEQGIIAFTANDGIHFARIEGYQLIKDAQSNQNHLREQVKLTTTNGEFNNTFASYHQFGWNVGNREAGTVAANSSRRVTYDYMNRDTRAQEASRIKYENLNRSFGNTYLEFLANAAISNNRQLGSPKYSFNLKNDVESWLSITANTPDRYWIAVWDYVKEIFGLVGNEGDETLFDAFFELEEIDNDRIRDLMTSYKNSILTTLRSNRGLILADPMRKLLTQWTTYAEDAEGQINRDSNIQYAPLNYLRYGTGPGDFTKLSNLNSRSIWRPDNQARETLSFNNIDVNKYIIDLNRYVNVDEGSVI